VVSVPILAYLLSPLLNPTRNAWVTVGRLSDFQRGETVEVAYDDPSPVAWAGQTARTGLWLRRDERDNFSAYALNCTHLGCPVRWNQSAELFFCPCHGGVYYSDGTVAGGPPPHPLFHYQVRVQGDEVQILTQPTQVVG
jgi:menaquinol-cytochrome c reductase iron-sulfur subunit